MFVPRYRQVARLNHIGAPRLPIPYRHQKRTEPSTQDRSDDLRNEGHRITCGVIPTSTKSKRNRADGPIVDYAVYPLGQPRHSLHPRAWLSQIVRNAIDYKLSARSKFPINKVASGTTSDTSRPQKAGAWTLARREPPGNYCSIDYSRPAKLPNPALTAANRTSRARK